MGIKSLGYDRIRAKANKLREIVVSTSSFSLSPQAEKFLTDNPLAPIIGTICDQQIKAEDAWEFPLWLSNNVSTILDSKTLVQLGKEKIKTLLRSYMGNKWPSGMSEYDREKYLSDTSVRLWETSKLIEAKYANDPDGLFERGNYTVPEIYFILRALPGVGPKKASMIARSFASHEGNWYLGLRKRLTRRGINLSISGKNLTEVPIDVHVVKVFGRLLGEFRDTPKREKFVDYVPDIQNFAKLVAPDFPARLDDIFWEVGRAHCSERQPRCHDCPLRDTPCEYATS